MDIDESNEARSFVQMNEHVNKIKQYDNIQRSNTITTNAS